MGYLVFLNEMIVERGLECYEKKKLMNLKF